MYVWGWEEGREEGGGEEGGGSGAHCPVCVCVVVRGGGARV